MTDEIETLRGMVDRMWDDYQGVVSKCEGVMDEAYTRYERVNDEYERLLEGVEV